MELEFQNVSCEYLRRTLFETRTQEETVELIVPDSYPDVQSIICAQASAIVRGKECRTGSVSVTGGIRTSAFYAPEDGSQPRVMDAYIPFTVRAEHAMASEKTELVCRCSVISADARMVNSRKILLRVNLLCQIEGFEPHCETLPQAQELPENVQVKSAQYQMLLPAQTAEKSFSVAEELNLPAGVTAVRVCCFDTMARITESKMVGNKAVFKGLLAVNVLYLGEDDLLHAEHQHIPFSQFCEMTEDFDEQPMQCTICVTGAEIEPDSSAQGKILLMNVQLLAQCVVSCARDIVLCEDAYAIGASFEPQWKQCALDALLDHQELLLDARGRTDVRADKILQVCAYTQQPQITQTAGQVRVDVPMHFYVLHYNAEGQLACEQVKTQAMTELALAESGKCFAVTQYDGAVRVSPSADGAELRADVNVDVQCYAQKQMQTLCGGTMEPYAKKLADGPSVIVCKCREQTSVWDLAKQYGTTTAAIRSANHLSTEETEAGELLLIPM